MNARLQSLSSLIALNPHAGPTSARPRVIDRANDIGERRLNRHLASGSIPQSCGRLGSGGGLKAERRRASPKLGCVRYLPLDLDHYDPRMLDPAAMPVPASASAAIAQKALPPAAA